MSLSVLIRLNVAERISARVMAASSSCSSDKGIHAPTHQLEAKLTEDAAVVGH
jgi:hypothetical protein